MVAAAQDNYAPSNVILPKPPSRSTLSAMTDDLYVRRCSVSRVIDGDTVHATIDLGYRMTTEQHIRLLGIDTPELRSGDAAVRAKAHEAKGYVFTWLSEHIHEHPNWPFWLSSRKGDSFGRWLGTLECRLGHNLNQSLLDVGLAVAYDG